MYFIFTVKRANQKKHKKLYLIQCNLHFIAQSILTSTIVKMLELKSAKVREMATREIVPNRPREVNFFCLNDNQFVQSFER